MNIREINIILLDDIGRALYKKLKKDADELVRIRCSIECKKLEQASLLEQWLYLEEHELDAEADIAYHRKHKEDLELQKLQRLEQELLQRIRQYAAQKTRSA
jgi:K+/H+ antiporter YhaU regulatory subunit KhtT